jgi:hypothetical protein
VLAHSLVRDHLDLLSKAAQGTITVHVEWNHVTGEAKHRLQMKLPPEEEFESFAARLRPFVMRKESVYWAVVLDALEKLLSEERWRILWICKPSATIGQRSSKALK